jgi:hypothetical protein
MIRTFSLNSDTAYDALRAPPDPWAWGPQLSRNSNWPREPAKVLVMAETEDEAEVAFKEWVAHVEAGRFGV